MGKEGVLCCVWVHRFDTCCARLCVISVYIRSNFSLLTQKRYKHAKSRPAHRLQSAVPEKD